METDTIRLWDANILAGTSEHSLDIRIGVRQRSFQS